MSPIVGLIISYLAGSIPSAYISGRLPASPPQARLRESRRDERRSRAGSKDWRGGIHRRSPEGISAGLLPPEVHRDAEARHVGPLLWRGGNRRSRQTDLPPLEGWREGSGHRERRVPGAGADSDVGRGSGVDRHVLLLAVRQSCVPSRRRRLPIAILAWYRSPQSPVFSRA